MSTPDTKRLEELRDQIVITRDNAQASIKVISALDVELAKAAGPNEDHQLADVRKALEDELNGAKPSVGSWRWALGQARSYRKIRRASWPFFVYLEWQEWGELGRLIWRCGPAGYWYPTTFDPEHEGKPSGECMVGQSMEFGNHAPWDLATDWEVFEGPIFGPIFGSAIADASLFVIDGIDATEDSMTYVVLQGDPPAGHVRPLRPGEGNYDRWKAEGVMAYALVSNEERPE